MRESEERAKREFTALLDGMGMGAAMWVNGEDPPDYWLEQDGRRYAVEVTEVMQRVAVGLRRFDERDVLESLKRAVAQIESDLAAEGALIGTFAVHAVPIPDLRPATSAIKTEILQYIRSNEHNSSAPSATLLKASRRRRWSISKIRPTGSALLAGFSAGSATFAIDAMEILRGLVAERLSTKANKYKHIEGDKVLLLVDSFLYLDWEDWTSTGALAAAAGFHTVAVISSIFGCRVLHSQNASWARAA